QFTLSTLRVDGGMVVNNLLMQLQADILGRPVVRASVSETSALGSAYAAGLAVGFFVSPAGLQSQQADHILEPTMTAAQRDVLYRKWQKAVKCSFNWEEPGS